MKEFIRILELYDKLDKETQKAALATVIDVVGSSYRRPGARMLITSDGKWEGAISGGCLEGDVLRKARKVMQNGEAELITYDTMDDSSDMFGIRLGCNGIIRILLEPIDFSDPKNPVLLLKKLVDIKEPQVLITIFIASIKSTYSIGQRLLFDDNTENLLPEWMENGRTIAMETGKSIVMMDENSQDTAAALFEIIQPQMQLVVFGAGYDVYPLMNMAKELGWRVVLSDECIVRIMTKQGGCADAIICGNSDDILNKIQITSRTAAILISHNYTNDVAMLKSLIQTTIPYIGVLGPRVRFHKMWDTEPEFASTDMDRIFAPIGLDIGAETPEEIALSILSEIKAFFAGRSGQSLKHRFGPIHERRMENVI